MSFETLHYHRKRLKARAADHLYGLALGMLADGYVSEQEAEYLLAWLNEHPEVRSGEADPVVRRIHGAVRCMLADGVYDAEEQRQLLALLCDFTGSPLPCGDAHKPSLQLPLCDPPPLIKFRDSSFCFTGTFAFGTRKRCESLLQLLGGVHSKGVTMKLNYLVVGHNVTPDWRHQSYGNKIIKAMEYRDDRGKPINIISERRWVDAVRAVMKRGAKE